MRSLTCALLLAVTVSLFGVGSSDAKAQYRGRYYRPAQTVYYNYQPNFNSYPWNYMATLPSNYGYMTPAWDFTYGLPNVSLYNPPSVSYYYSLPSYQYYYGPGYGAYSYNPGGYYYWLR